MTRARDLASLHSDGFSGTELILDADGDTSITADTDDQVDIKTGGTDRFEINASGNVEVLNGNFTIDKSSSPNLLFNVNGTEKGYIRQNSDELECNSADGALVFRTGGTEHARMLQGGKFCIDSTSAESTSQDNLQIDPEGHIYFYQNTDALQGILDFRNTNGYIGSIRTTGSAVQFNTSSDYRMKDNVNYTWSATDTLKSLKQCSFTLKVTLVQLYMDLLHMNYKSIYHMQ